MAKQKTQYVCQSCSHIESKWLGRCPACGEWNQFVEEVKQQNKKVAQEAKVRKVPVKPLSLEQIDDTEANGLSTGIREFDRVLGGGILSGAAVLLGGEPGIGKSTLMLQLCTSIKLAAPILYIAGEESPSQIKLRASRLAVGSSNLRIFAETNLDKILSVLEREKPGLIIIDSIQTIYSPELGSVPGTVNQIKYGSYEIIDWAKEHNAACIFVAHVTKGGIIAGPKVMEHIVDTVLYFDHNGHDVRFLRASKNRFGSVDEIGLFTMTEKGLAEVKDPAALFLSKRSGPMPYGVAIAPVYEGSRILMTEIQALLVPAKGGLSRVYSEKIDSNKVSRIAAILEKHIGLRFSDQDIYINVAGGLRLGEVAVDLALAAALYSARTELPCPEGSAFAAELSLAGELRPVSHWKRRMSAAGDSGFKLCYGAAQSEQEDKGKNCSLHEQVRPLLKEVFQQKT